MDPIFDIAGKVIVVTGGMGQLGRAFVDALERRGALVAIFDKAVPDKTVQSSDSRLTLPVDVVKQRSLQAGLDAVVKHWDVPQGLINNAALDSPPNATARENGPFETYPESSWDEVMAVNVKGVFLTCQVVGDAMAKAGRGSIVNVSSIYGLVSPDQRIYAYREQDEGSFKKPIAYSTSKSALYNFTRYLATYWAPRGVRTNTVTFGGVFNNQDQVFLTEYTKRVPLGRMADPQDYIGAIIFLLSPASSYMTGANMVVDGGWTAW